MTLIDTHCHLDAAGLDADRAAVATRACGGRGDYRHPSAIQTLQARFSGITASAKAGGRASVLAAMIFC